MKPEQRIAREIPPEHWQSPHWKKLKNKKRATMIEIDTDQLAPEEYTNRVSYKTCQHCKGEGILEERIGICHSENICPLCRGNTAFGVSPYETQAWPGTKEKVAILAARYAEGLPLHREDDIKVTPESIDILELV